MKTFAPMRILAYLLMVFSVPAYANAENEKMLLTLKNGQSIEMPLIDEDNNPIEIFFYEEYQENETTLVCGIGDQYFQFPEISNYKILSTSGIEDIPAPISFDIKGDAILIRGAKGEGIHIYSISGTCIHSSSNNMDGTINIDISSLSPGVYVITTGSQTFKFIKK
ncbi:MAG: T9SS type A sorting domain-containing protein [Lachnospiraceae bacterium]|nr:T9SS type A sorting domain-containing protein [Lachnospiraceae bacterium]